MSSAAARLCPLASISDATVKPSGSLCRKIATNTTLPSHVDTKNAEAIATPSKNVWITRPEQRRVTRVRAGNLLVVGLLAKMEMRRDGVLEKVHHEISRQDENENRAGVAEEVRRGPPAQLQGLRNHFHQRRGQHESGAESDEIPQIKVGPVAAGRSASRR